MSVKIPVGNAAAEIEQAARERAAAALLPKGVYLAYVNSVEDKITEKQDKATGEINGHSIGFFWSFTILEQVEGWNGGLVEDARAHAGKEINKVYTYVGFRPLGAEGVESMANARNTINILEAIDVPTDDEGNAIIERETVSRKLVLLVIDHKPAFNAAASDDPTATPQMFPDVKGFRKTANPGERYEGIDFGGKMKEEPPF